MNKSFIMHLYATLFLTPRLITAQGVEPLPKRPQRAVGWFRAQQHGFLELIWAHFENTLGLVGKTRRIDQNSRSFDLVAAVFDDPINCSRQALL